MISASTAIAGTFVLCAVVSTILSQNYLRWRQKHTPLEQQIYVPLADVLHRSWNRDWIRYRWIADLVTDAYLATAAFVIIAQDRQAAVFGTIAAGIYTLRAMLSCITIIPPCNPHYNEGVRARIEAVSKLKGTPVPDGNTTSSSTEFRFLIAVHEGVHFDLIISGHCTIMSLVVMHLTHCGGLPELGDLEAPILATMWTVALINSIWIVLCRCHYLICIVIAWTFAVGAHYIFAPLLARLFHIADLQSTQHLST